VGVASTVAVMLLGVTAVLIALYMRVRARGTDT
jgi:hypothetical protein